MCEVVPGRHGHIPPHSTPIRRAGGRRAPPLPPSQITHRCGFLSESPLAQMHKRETLKSRAKQTFARHERTGNLQLKDTFFQKTSTSLGKILLDSGQRTRGQVGRAKLYLETLSIFPDDKHLFMYTFLNLITATLYLVLQSQAVHSGVPVSQHPHHPWNSKP